VAVPRVASQADVRLALDQAAQVENRGPREADPCAS